MTEHYGLKTIEIPEESSLQTICDSFISFTVVKKIFILSSVKNLKNNWCHYSSSLKTVKISPLSKNFQYLNENHQIIIGKIDTNSDVFDTIVFANRGIQRATIPKFIECIKTNAFENCDKLKVIEIPNELVGIHFHQQHSQISRFYEKLIDMKKIFYVKFNKIYCFEFHGDYCEGDNYESIFNELVNSFIISFPNVKELNISIDELQFKSKGFNSVGHC